jgi:uncharacterized membrane protein
MVDPQRSVPNRPHARAALSDERMDGIMGRLLQAGVLLASAVVFAGGALYLLRNRAAIPAYRTFRAEPIPLRDPVNLLGAVAHAHASAVIQLGVLLLIATPVARVVFAVFAFALQRDRLYVGISLFVLAILLASILFLN